MTAERPSLVPTGVEPIDSALGGFEAGRAHVLYGEAETGKTSIGLRFLVEGLHRGETGLLVVRYPAEQAVAAMADLGYDCGGDLHAGRLVLYEYTSDIVDRLAHVDGLLPVLDELTWLLSDIRPQRIVFDTADFVFSIQFGYGYPLQISAFTNWLAHTGAASLLLVDERMPDRVVQSFRVHGASVIHATTRRFDERLEYHLAFEKSAIKAPSRRIRLDEGAFSTLEIYDARARTLPLPAAPRRHYEARDRTGQLTMPDEAGRIVAEAAASSDAIAPESSPAPAAAPAPAAPPPRAQTRTGRPRVLVIDEDRVTCRLVARALAGDYEIAVEADGISGLARLGSFDPDLVVLEINLPIVDGFGVCRQIRETSPVPVLVVTRTHVTQSDRVRSAEVGADHFLPKPFALKELAVRAKQLIARYRNEPIPTGAGFGELPSDPLVSYDEFVEGLLLRSSGPMQTLVGYRFPVTESSVTARIIDVVRGELPPDARLAYEPDERQLVALVAAEGAAETARHLAARIREELGVEAEFWVAPIAKGSAVRVLTEQFERDRRTAAGAGLEAN